jgi:hypothetical protein
MILVLGIIFMRGHLFLRSLLLGFGCFGFCVFGFGLYGGFR